MTMTTDPVAEQALVGIPQIADIANVGRSAVGNWRKRHPDFPTPKVQAPSGALFDLREVEDWLIEQGKISKRAPASARLWGLADATRAVWTSDEFVRFSVAFLVYLEACTRAHGENPPVLELARPSIPAGAAWTDLRRRQSFRGFVHAFAGAARGIEAANPDLDGLLDPQLDERQSDADPLARRIAATLDDAAADYSARLRVFEGLADLASADRFSGEFSTPADVAGLLAALMDFQGGVILDPVVGEGRLLWQTAYDRPSAAETRTGDARVVGIDVNRDACRRTRSRFYLSGRSAEIRNENALMAHWDSLPKADVIVADPPYGLANWGDADLYVDPRWTFGSPPPQSADFAFLQFIAQQLKPTGRAAVLMNMGSLFKGGREGAIRQHMVETGAVEAIIALPPRLRLNTSIPLALWLLRHPSAPSTRDEILLVDASDMADRGRSRFSLPQESIDRIRDVVFRWRETQQLSEEDAERAASVPMSDILAADAVLTPRRFLKVPQVDTDALQLRATTLRSFVRESSGAAASAYTELLSYLERRE
jgi:type I restriction enzyme M protein